MPSIGKQRDDSLRAAVMFFKQRDYKASSTAYEEVVRLSVQLLETLSKDNTAAPANNNNNSSSTSTSTSSNNTTTNSSSSSTTTTTSTAATTSQSIHAAELVLAVAEVGLGLCQTKLLSYEEAIETLKSAIETLYDDLFLKEEEEPPPKKKGNNKQTIPNRPKRKTDDSTNHQSTPPSPSSSPLSATAAGLLLSSGGTGSITTVLSQVVHLLNALEALSDCYAQLRKW